MAPSARTLGLEAQRSAGLARTAASNEYERQMADAIDKLAEAVSKIAFKVE